MVVAAYQNAVREQKLAAEISAAKRERDFYMGQVDKAKGIEAMKERKRKVSFGLTSHMSILAWVCKASLPFKVVHVVELASQYFCVVSCSLLPAHFAVHCMSIIEVL